MTDDLPMEQRYRSAMEAAWDGDLRLISELGNEHESLVRVLADTKAQLAEGERFIKELESQIRKFGTQADEMRDSLDAIESRARAAEAQLEQLRTENEALKDVIGPRKAGALADPPTDWELLAFHSAEHGHVLTIDLNGRLNCRDCLDKALYTGDGLGKPRGLIQHLADLSVPVVPTPSTQEPHDHR